MSLSLDSLISNSISSIVNESKKQTEVNESNGLDVNLEDANKEENKNAEGAEVSDLALDLESMEEQFELDLDPAVLENIKGAIGAGVATYAVLEAREEARIKAEAAKQQSAE